MRNPNSIKGRLRVWIKERHAITSNWQRTEYEYHWRVKILAHETANIEEMPQNVERIFLKSINLASKMKIIPDTPE